MKRTFIASILIMLLISCSTVPTGDTSRDALDWPGTYQCDKMTITLKANNTYIARVGDVEIRSSFKWNRQGSSICLDNFNIKESCKKFKVGENMLIPLKNSGKVLKDGAKMLKIAM